jgi:cytochrome c peroxidase
MRKSVLISLLLISGVFSKGDADRELLAKAKQHFSPLPKGFPSADNPITPQKVELGRLLFFERRLSVNDMISCATCHAIEYYYAVPAPKQMGALALQRRHAPTVLNSAGQLVQHWIGNRKDVEDKALQSLTGQAALGNPSRESVEEKLRKIPQYVELFRKAFPEDKEPITAENIAKAIGAFERTLVTPSRFDEFLKGNTKALTPEEKRGLKTFIEVGCATCHNGALLGGTMYQKFGVYEPYWKYTKSESIDEGRFAVTKNEEDRYVFKVPPLRNVAMTAPYFHDGSVASLEEAVWIMGKVQLGKDLTKEQVRDIVAFLKSLTGKIPKEARTPPILPQCIRL